MISARMIDSHARMRYTVSEKYKPRLRRHRFGASDGATPAARAVGQGARQRMSANGKKFLPLRKAMKKNLYKIHHRRRGGGRRDRLFHPLRAVSRRDGGDRPHCLRHGRAPYRRRGVRVPCEQGTRRAERRRETGGARPARERKDGRRFSLLHRKTGAHRRTFRRRPL